MIVFAAAQGGPVDLDDLELRKNYSFSNVVATGASYNDLMTEEFSTRYPNVAFMHNYPGIVDTGILNNMPWFVKYPGNLYLTLAGIKPEDSGDYLWHGFHLPDRKTGWYLLGAKGDTIKTAKYHTEEARKAVWEHTVTILKL